MKITEKRLKKILTKPGYITEEQFREAVKGAEQENKDLQTFLVESDLISDENLGKLIAEELGYNFIDLRNETIPEEIIKIVPELVAQNQQVIVFDKNKDGLKIAMADPGNFEMIDWLEKKTGKKIVYYYASSRDIREALKYYRKELKKTFEEIIQEQAKLAKAGKVKSEDVPIIKIVDTLIKYAYENRASDIHIEPLEDKTQVRFRIDGILHNVLTLPKDIHNLIVTRIKVLSKLRTDEHFAAQDGKFIVRFSKGKLGSEEIEKFDIRTSIIPVTEGENIVMRLLSGRVRRLTLENLGFLEKDLKKIEKAIKNPYGMILATGPTGCGKTTTLYAILKVLNKPNVNICTIEDPVEYGVEGVSQIQINPKTNLTFAQGLRSIVRQDPEIIMVGEIRDNETAGIAINSAMTGHLVLSTMHANTAATNLIRLMDMEIEPFLTASSISLIIAQKLVRKICPKCRESYEITKDEFKKTNLAHTFSATENFKDFSEDFINKLFKDKEKIRVYHGKGCRACVNTGYSGRTGIFEVLDIQDNIRKLIMKKANADQIQEQAIKNGMTTTLEDGIEKVFLGITTIDEVIRTTRE